MCKLMSTESVTLSNGFPNVVPFYSRLQCFLAPEKSPRKPIQNHKNLTDQNQSIFLGRTDADTETATVWPPDAKN